MRVKEPMWLWMWMGIENEKVCVGLGVAYLVMEHR